MRAGYLWCIRFESEYQARLVRLGSRRHDRNASQFHTQLWTVVRADRFWLSILNPRVAGSSPVETLNRAA